MQREQWCRKGWRLCPGFVQVMVEFSYGTHKAAEINLHFPQNLIYLSGEEEWPHQVAQLLQLGSTQAQKSVNKFNPQGGNDCLDCLGLLLAFLSPGALQCVISISWLIFTILTKTFLPAHFFLDIVWKVVEWLFKIVFEAVDFLEGWEQRGHCAVAAPGTRWWHWCQLLRGMRLLLSDGCGDEWFYTQEKSPYTICCPSAYSFHSIQYSTTFSCSFLNLFAIIKISFLSSRACHSLLHLSGWWKAASWRCSSGYFSSTDIKVHRCQGHCSGKDSQVTSALSLSEAAAWYKVLQKWTCAAPWVDTNPLQRGLELVLQSQTGRCDTHPALPSPCNDSLRQKVGNLTRGGKAALRWQGWAVRDPVLLWVSGHLRK